MEDAVRGILEVFGLVVIAYFVLLNVIYLFFTLVAGQSLSQYMRRRTYQATESAMASPLTPPISVLLPAYNEEAGIVPSVHSLLDLRYPEYEVVVVDDGSKDDTVARLQDEFDLVPVRIALRQSVPHAAVLETMVSKRDPRLIVIRKENGGKADALNTGLCAASFPFVCSLDADTLIEEEALLRVAMPIIEQPDKVVATGGIVRIANGCRIEAGRVVEVGLPKSRLATMQVVEYFRAFLVGRIAWSRLSALLIISGAFGLFRRSAVEEVGGWWTDTVGEDAELVARIHHEFGRSGRDYRVEFVPDPVCWTEAPESLRVLGRQRRRWQRGLCETISRHRTTIGNPRYGAFGMLAMPFYLVFEMLGPIVALGGYLVLPIAALLGLLSVELMVAFMIVALLLGILLSVSALALEELSFRRHTSNREAARLLLYAVLDNLGYRQLNDVYRGLGLLDFLRRGKHSWGEMERRGIGQVEDGAAVPADVDRAGTPAR
jgi:cellulose synthase/poly-beta-1,6-N-acetylglucosamine synthase-like glycosyltransferase